MKIKWLVLGCGLLLIKMVLAAVSNPCDSVRQGPDCISYCQHVNCSLDCRAICSDRALNVAPGKPYALTDAELRKSE